MYVPGQNAHKEMVSIADHYKKRIEELEEKVQRLQKTIDLCEAAIDEASSFVDGYYLESGKCLLPVVKEAYAAIDAAREEING